MKTKNYLFILAMSLLVAAKTIAQPSGWMYSMPITVTNTTASLVTGYQLKITIDTQTPVGAAQMLASGDDIRFGKECSGSTLFNYWIEDGMNTAATDIWVKIDTLPAGGSTTFYMFYGNAGATAVSAVSGTFSGPHSSTDSVSGANTGGVTNSQRGFRFSTSEDLLVTAFGKNEPNGSTRYVTLFDFSTQAILSQYQVSGPAAQYSYANIPNPLWLTQGTQYLLEIYQDVADGYYFGAAPQIGQHLTYYDMRYCNGCGQNTFPTNSLGGMHYGYVDLWYFTKVNIASAPTIVYGVPSPANTTSAANSTICSGNVATLIASSPNTIGWYDASSGGNYLGGGSTYITPVLNSTATFYVQDSSACAISTRAAVVVTVNALPALSVSGTTTICEGDATTLTAAGADTYQWVSGPATDANTVSPTSTATFTVVGTNASTGCFDSLTQIVTVNTLPVLSVSGNTSVCENATGTITANGADTYQWTSGPATDQYVFSGLTSNTTFTVVGTNSVTNCSNTATQLVTVNAPPVVSVTASQFTSIECEGSMDTLIASGADTYAWSTTETNDTIVVTHTPGVTSWTVIGTDLNGCMDTVATSVAGGISALLPVTLDFQTIDTTCVDFSFVTLGGETPAGGTWSGTAVSGTNFDASVAGLGTHAITYIVLNSDLCPSSATENIFVDVCLGLNEEKNTGLHIFPNPNNGAFTIKALNEGVYRLVNELGQDVRVLKLNAANSYTFTFEGLTNGVYYLTGYSGSKVLRQRIVVAK